MYIHLITLHATKTERIERRNRKIHGDFNTTLSVINRTSRHKISKEIKEVNNIKQLNLIDVYRTVYPTADYTFLSHNY